VPVSVLQVLGVKVCTDGSVESNDLFINYNYQLQEIFNNKIIAIKKKPIKKGNNEIITQYLRVSLRSNTSRPVWAYLQFLGLAEKDSLLQLMIWP
jgi:hypothetical protein